MQPNQEESQGKLRSKIVYFEDKCIESNISKNDKEEYIKIKPNVEFYENSRVCCPNEVLIDEIHKKWWGKYDWLQKNHNYIQWLFPNSYESPCNPKLFYCLTLQQSQEFINNKDIAFRYVKSYEMMLEFYGMRLISKKTGQIGHTKITDYKQRYLKTLLKSLHNHLQITRILSSLNMTGFSCYSKQLYKFLMYQISQGNLKKLKKYNVEKDWSIFNNKNNILNKQLSNISIYLRNLYYQEEIFKTKQISILKPKNIIIINDKSQQQQQQSFNNIVIIDE